MKRLAFFFFTVIVFLSACKTPPKKPALPEKAYKDFAQKIESTFAAGDTSFFVRNFDVKELVDTIINESKMAPSVAITMRGSMLRAFDLAIRQLAVLVRDNAVDGGYQLLRTRSDSTGYYALYRMFMKGSINYHEYKLVEKDGKVGIGNMFIYFTGQTLSETISQTLSGQMGNNTSLLNAMQKTYQNKGDNEHIGAMTNFIRMGDFESARSEYEKISPEFQRSRSVQILYLQICQRGTNNEYGEALENFRMLFPNDPSTAVLGIDYYYTQGNYVMALRSVDQLDSMVHDPLLNLYRGNCLKLLGRGDSGIACLKRALPQIKSGPKDFCYRSLYLIEISSQQTDAAARLLAEMRDSTNLSRSDLRTLSLLNTDVYEHPAVSSWIDGGN